MNNLLRIVEIQPHHSDFVSDVIKRRWDVTEKKALDFVEQYLTKQNTSNCFVAEYDKMPVGMGTFHVNNDIGIDLHPWCIGLWVRPDYRGNGIGYKLTLRRFSWARQLGYKKIYLDTVNAQKYHSRFGWKTTGLMGMYDGTPTEVMEYDL